MAGIKGMQEVLDNIAKETRGIVGASASGVLKGGLLVMRESQRLTPVDSGNLRNSRFLVTDAPGFAGDIGGGKFRGEQAGAMGSRHAQVKQASSSTVAEMSKGGRAPTVAVGYSAVYALSVHENPRAGKTGKPGASTVGVWKFLETALKANASRILEIIRKDARVD